MLIYVAEMQEKNIDWIYNFLMKFWKLFKPKSLSLQTSEPQRYKPQNS